jgi:DNA-binding LytR/AlgR family response regulator
VRNMIRVAVIDDEKHHRRVINRYIEQLQLDIKEKIDVYEFDSGEALLKSLDKGYHIIFLDQKMPGLSGFETAEKIRSSDKSVIIIFVTAIEELWEDGYGVQAFYYLTKPIDERKFSSVFKRAVAKIQEERRPVTIQTMSGLFVFDIMDILYMKKNQRYTDLYYFERESGSIKVEKIRNSIKAVASQFESLDFVRPHVSYLVNPLHIRRITESNRDKYLELVTGEKIYISRDRVNSVFEIVMRSLDKRTYVVLP